MAEDVWRCLLALIVGQVLVSGVVWECLGVSEGMWKFLCDIQGYFHSTPPTGGVESTS